MSESDIRESAIAGSFGSGSCSSCKSDRQRLPAEPGRYTPMAAQTGLLFYISSSRIISLGALLSWNENNGAAANICRESLSDGNWITVLGHLPTNFRHFDFNDFRQDIITTNKFILKTQIRKQLRNKIAKQH